MGVQVAEDKTEGGEFVNDLLIGTPGSIIMQSAGGPPPPEVVAGDQEKGAVGAVFRPLMSNQRQNAAGSSPRA